MKLALQDNENGRRDLRCPYCNSWDCGFWTTNPGKWECDVCYELFLITQEALDWQRE
jgi:hypothetical protein